MQFKKKYSYIKILNFIINLFFVFERICVTLELSGKTRYVKKGENGETNFSLRRQCLLQT